MKTRCLLTLLDRKGVGLGMFTDVRFPSQGLRHYSAPVQDWFVVNVGLVAFVMNLQWYKWWQLGGCVVVQGSAIDGLFVIGVYAPTSQAPLRERRALLQQVEDVMDQAPGAALRLIVARGFFDAANQFAQRARGAWWHPRFGSNHILDHCLVDSRRKWHLRVGRILRGCGNWTITAH